MSRLIPSSTVGRRWAAVIAAAQPYRREGVDPMALWRIVERRLQTVRLDGPIVYLAIGHQIAQYVGQTHDTMQVRLNKHMCSEAKAQNWSHMACITLDLKTPALVVNDLETTAREIMKPLMGSRTPRRRETG